MTKPLPGNKKTQTGRYSSGSATLTFVLFPTGSTSSSSGSTHSYSDSTSASSGSAGKTNTRPDRSVQIHHVHHVLEPAFNLDLPLLPLDQYQPGPDQDPTRTCLWTSTEFKPGLREKTLVFIQTGINKTPPFLSFSWPLVPFPSRFSVYVLSFFPPVSPALYWFFLVIFWCKAEVNVTRCFSYSQI